MSGSIEAEPMQSVRHLCVDKDRGRCKSAAEGAACAENDDITCSYVGGGRYIHGIPAAYLPSS